MPPRLSWSGGGADRYFRSGLVNFDTRRSQGVWVSTWYDCYNATQYATYVGSLLHLGCEDTTAGVSYLGCMNTRTGVSERVNIGGFRLY